MKNLTRIIRTPECYLALTIILVVALGVFSENAIIGASNASGYDIDYSARFTPFGSSSRLLGTVTIGSQTSMSRTPIL